MTKFKWLRTRLKRKITFILILIPALVAIFIVLATQSVATGSILAVKKDSIKDASISEANNIAQAFDMSYDLASSIAETARAKEFLADPTKKENVPNIIYSLKSMNYIKNIRISDENGIIVAASDNSRIGKAAEHAKHYHGTSVADSKFYKEINYDEKTVSYYVHSRVADKSGNLVGYVEIEVTPDQIYNNLNKTTLKDVGNVMVYDEDGVIIYGSDQSIYLNSLWTLDEAEKEAMIANGSTITNIESRGNEKARDAVANYSGSSIFDVLCAKENNAKNLFSIAKVGEYPLYVSAKIVEKDLTADLLRGGNLLAIFDFVAIAIGASIVTWLIFRFIKPIKNIQKVTEGIAHGDLQQDVNIKTIDEFREIGDTLLNITDGMSKGSCKKFLTDNSEELEQDGTQKVTDQLKDDDPKVDSIS